MPNFKSQAQQRAYERGFQDGVARAQELGDRITKVVSSLQEQVAMLQYELRTRTSSDAETPRDD